MIDTRATKRLQVGTIRKIIQNSTMRIKSRIFLCLVLFIFIAPFARAGFVINAGVGMSNVYTGMGTPAQAGLLQLEAVYKTKEILEFGLFADNTLLRYNNLPYQNWFFGLVSRIYFKTGSAFNMSFRLDPVNFMQLLYSTLTRTYTVQSRPFSGFGVGIGYRIQVKRWLTFEPQLGMRFFYAPNPYFTGNFDTLGNLFTLDAGLVIGFF